MQDLRLLRQAKEAEILRSFADLLALPNAANDAHGLLRNASFLRSELEKRELEVEVLELPGAAPLLIATSRVPGARSTLGIYAHYDGQPVDESRWTDPPWTPTLRSSSIAEGGRVLPLPEPGEKIDPESRMHARSAADDKASIAALLAGLDLIAESNVLPSHNSIILLEGEEEIGSPNLARYLEMAKSSLGADGWVVLDGPMSFGGRAQVVLGVRGFVGVDITVYGAGHPLHSGTFGNWAPSPAMDLVHLVASMKDRRGQITIAGLRDLCDPVDPATRKAQAALPQLDQELCRELALPSTTGEAWTLGILQPCLNLRGISAGGVGGDARNEIPDRACASFDLRLVPGATPDQVLECIENHLRAQGFHLTDSEPDEQLRRSTSRLASIDLQPGYPATRISPNHVFAKSIAGIVELASAQEPLLVPTVGGSLPLSCFEVILEAPVLIVPIANPDNGQHGPDENLRLGNLWYGVDLAAALLTQPIA